MAEAKTKPTAETLSDFLDRVSDETRRADCEKVAAMMEKATGRPAVIWGSGIVGFGRYRYVYKSGREGEWPILAFAPRKNDLTLYILSGTDTDPTLMEALGKFKRGGSCLYIKKLSEVHLPTLTKLLKRRVDAMKKERVD